VQHLKKVVVIGPECTGKSDLSQYLAGHFNTVWVPEFARGYLDNLVRPYEQHDLLTIAHGQVRIENALEKQADEILICDTNLIVIKIWSQFKYGSVQREIVDLIDSRKYDLYLLTYIDIPWENDPLREHPDKREVLYNLYLEEMLRQRVPFIQVKGERDVRRKLAVDAIEKLLTH